MIITPSAFAAYATAHNFFPQRQPAVGQAGASTAPDNTRVTISQAAREVLAAAQVATAAEPQNAIEARLAKIKATSAMERTADDTNFLWENDKRLAEIGAKDFASRTADEIDYMQKAGGFVNSMQNLSAEEKALYDELVAKGEMEAAGAITAIALIRTMGHTAGGVEGTTYDPINTTITAENILKFFKHSIVDPTGKSDAQFQALVKYLQARETETAAQDKGVGGKAKG